MKLVAVLALAWVGACASPKSPRLETGGVGVSTSDAGIYIQGTNYDMTFPPAGVRLPSSMGFGGGEVLGTTNACPFESRIGFALYPVAVAVGGGTAPGTGTASVELAGPAVAKVATTFDVPYQCGNSTQHLTGSSTFTFYPTRIIREDTNVRSSTTVLAGSSGCGCNTGTDKFYFTSMWAFRPATDVDPSGAAAPPPQQDAPRGCSVYPSGMIGVSWLTAGTTRRPRNGRDSEYVFDFFPSGQPTTDLTPRAVRSAIAIAPNVEPTECGMVLRELGATTLLVDGTLLTSGPDGIVVDPTRHRESFELSPPSGDVSSFAISLDLGGADHLQVTSSLGREVGYTAQTDGDRLILWFGEGLPPRDILTIVPK